MTLVDGATASPDLQDIITTAEVESIKESESDSTYQISTKFNNGSNNNTTTRNSNLIIAIVLSTVFTILILIIGLIVVLIIAKLLRNNKCKLRHHLSVDQMPLMDSCGEDVSMHAPCIDQMPLMDSCGEDVSMHAPCSACMCTLK